MDEDDIKYKAGQLAYYENCLLTLNKQHHKLTTELETVKTDISIVLNIIDELQGLD